MPNKVAIALLLLLAVVLRAWDFPHRHELRDSDELGYVSGSLHLLEGMTPPYKFAPAGPQVWAGWAYAGARSAWYVAQPTVEERAVDARVRPFVATNHALWDAYADMAQTRSVWVLVTLPLALWAIVEAFKLGVYATGPPKIVIAGGSDGPEAARLPDDGPPIDGPPIAAESSASPTIAEPPVGEPPIAAPERPATPSDQPAAAAAAAATDSSTLSSPSWSPTAWRNPVGTAAGFLVAGFVAFMPMYIDLGSQGRPYMTAWSLGIIALSLVVRRGDERGQALSAVAMGLSIASRIDMLVLLPVAWSELFARRRRTRGLIRSFVGYHAIVAITALLAAPWIVTNLIGNLRIIATVRLSAVREVSVLQTLRDFAWNEGLWLLPVLALLGALWPRLGRRVPRLLLAAYVVLLGMSVFKATAYGLRHQGGPLVVLIVMSAFAIRPLMRLERPAGVAWAGAVLAVLLPAAQSVRGIAARQRAYVDDAPAIAWIEQNVPPATRLYTGWHVANPLPTRAAADALWAEVNDGRAWERKFLAGLARFNVSAGEIPRALSEENMLQEKGNRRAWFILGSRGDRPGRPRYDVRLIGGSPIFGVHDLAGEFARTGGVVLWRGTMSEPDVAGVNATPTMQWLARNGVNGVFVFVSPDVKLLAGGATTRRAATQRAAAPATTTTTATASTTSPPVTKPAATTATTPSAP